MNPWIGWNIVIGDKAYTAIRPLALELRPKTIDKSDGLLWWRRSWTEETGDWEIKMMYDRGPMSARKTDIIEFESEFEARSLYDQLCNNIFNEQKQSVAKNKKPTKKKPDLHLV